MAERRDVATERRRIAQAAVSRLLAAKRRDDQAELDLWGKEAADAS